MIDQPDGTWIDGAATCEACGRYRGPTPPRESGIPIRFLVLCGHAYCAECFPKAVATLEAMTKAIHIQRADEARLLGDRADQMYIAKEARRRMSEI